MTGRDDGSEETRKVAYGNASGIDAARDAAAMLELACRDCPTGPDEERPRLYLDSVEDLARSLGLELASLSGRITAKAADTKTGDGNTSDADPAGAALVSAALRAADLANLAACALPELPRQSPASFRVAAAARLAAGAAHSLSLEHRALADPADYAARDLRGAEWRASLAARQVDEALQEEA